jgi:hypothetical protein
LRIVTSASFLANSNIKSTKAMPSTRSRAGLDDDATTTLEEVRVVAPIEPTEPVPAANGNETVTGAKSKKKKKGKKGKKGKKEETVLENGDEQDENDSPIEPTGTNGLLGNGDVGKDVAAEKTTDEGKLILIPVCTCRVTWVNISRPLQTSRFRLDFLKLKLINR